eukprot:Skav206265  [mRNA]  locus=scaffold265:244596:255091:- [translate_table: standard]
MEPMIAPVTDLSDSDLEDKEKDNEWLQKQKSRRRRRPRLKKKRPKANELVQVFEKCKAILDGSGDTGKRTRWEFLDEKVCLRCFKRLHGLGSGRFGRIRTAVAEGSHAAPVDKRYLRRGKFITDKNGELLSGVLSFLEKVYSSVAESLPDVRDATFELPDGERPDDSDDVDPYSKVFDLAIQPDEKISKAKKHKRGVEVCPFKTTAAGCEIRWLPPGTIKEYWVQYKQMAGSDREWSSATGLARAFSIGPKESQAVYSLLCKVPEAIRDRLEAAVKTRGMSKLLSHDVIGKGCFDLGWTSASGSTESWFDSATDQLRAPLLYKDAVKLHLSCGAFLFFLQKLEQMAPSGGFADMQNTLKSQFMSGFLDNYLVAALESQVPATADIKTVQGFRKGILCYRKMLDTIISMDQITDRDRVVWQCEFGRACLQRLLNGVANPIKYFGIVREKYLADLNAAFESQVYNKWDSDSNLSPPSTRPPTQRRLDAQSLGLEIIAMQNDRPVFPLDVLLARFNEGAPEVEVVKKMKEDFETAFSAFGATTTTTRATESRASGQCDFSVDDGAKPVNVTRELQLAWVPIGECPAATDRLLGVVPGRQGKPTVVVCKNHQIWLLNPTEEDMEVTAGELFGFGTGQFANVVDCA